MQQVSAPHLPLSTHSPHVGAGAHRHPHQVTMHVVMESANLQIARGNPEGKKRQKDIEGGGRTINGKSIKTFKIKRIGGQDKG